MDDFTPMTRGEALRQGLRHYRTGRPCGYGHESVRYTSSGACKACQGLMVERGRREVYANALGWPEATVRVPPDALAPLRRFAAFLTVPGRVAVANHWLSLMDPAGAMAPAAVVEHEAPQQATGPAEMARLAAQLDGMYAARVARGESMDGIAKFEPFIKGVHDTPKMKAAAARKAAK